MTSQSSRRGFLAGAGLAALGAAGGVAAGVSTRHKASPRSPVRPATLVEAAAAERALLTAIDIALAGHVAPAAMLRAIRADHEAHLNALHAAIDLAAPGASPSPTAAQPTPTVGTRAQLRAGERAAAAATAHRAAGSTGREAALLASIAACEASHAELLT